MKKLVLAALVAVFASLFAPGMSWAQESSILNQKITLSPDSRDSIVIADQEPSDPGYARALKAYEQAQQEGRARGYSGDAIMLDDLVLSGSLFGGVNKTLNRADEVNYTSWWSGAQADVQMHVGNLSVGDSHIRLETGLFAKSMGGGFDAHNAGSFSSLWYSLSVGPQIILRDDPLGGKIGLWSLSLRPYASYMQTRGDNSLGYSMRRETWFAGLESEFDLYWPCLGLGTSKRMCFVRGAPAIVVEGFCPKIVLWTEFLAQVHSRGHGKLADGTIVSDHAHENSFTAVLRPHLWRWASKTLDTDQKWLWETSLYGAVGFSTRQASGYMTIDDNEWVTSLILGTGLEVVLNRSASLTMEGSYNNELDTHRGSWTFQFSLNIWGVFSNLGTPRKTNAEK